PFAWELLTGSPADGGYGFPESRLWVTVYHDDDEAAEIWERVVGVPPERIQRRGKEDNFWSMGVPGPCGPCSEIYFDRGPEHGRTATMLIADGVVPGNEGRGYVLRRMLRRAVRNARLLGADEPVMPPLVAAVRDVMSPMYPDVESDFERISRVATAEEES